jgi:hypothetical protein
LVDDTTDNGDRPLGRIILRHWTIELTNAIHIKTQTVFSTQLMVDYYNDSNAVWEPLLEPWSFKFKVCVFLSTHCDISVAN